MIKYIVLTALFITATYARGQWGEPVNLGPNVNSPSFECGHCLTPTEDTIIFASDRPGGKGGYDLWYSWKDKGKWAPAKNMGDSINTSWNENSPHIPSDGRLLYLSSTRPNGPGDYDIYVAERKNGVWQVPCPLTYPVNTSHSEVWPCLSLDGNQLYFSSDRHGGKGHLDLWVSEKKDGKWTEPVNMGDSVNGPGWELSPFLSIDGGELYFRRDTVTQNRPSVLWRSLKVNGVWKGAEKLGPPVNKEDKEIANPALSKDGKRLYFNSDQKPNLGLSDIFVTERKDSKP